MRIHFTTRNFVAVPVRRCKSLRVQIVHGTVQETSIHRTLASEFHGHFLRLQFKLLETLFCTKRTAQT
jgi:hypothetical protein